MSDIRGIFFDMDGVLVDAREWHYRALNQALELFGFTIDMKTHLSTYDGLPTRTKLEILQREQSLPPGLFKLINQLKQRYTMDMILQHCRPQFHHLYMLSRLKTAGYQLALCSNSIRKTVETISELANLNRYLDIHLSNEDVKEVKPDPEIYLLAMEKTNLQPEQCLIVEDNPNGIAAAKASGAHVLEVEGPDQVNHGSVMSAIAQAETGS